MVNRINSEQAAADSLEGSVNFAAELAGLFRRDLTRLAQELRAFPDDGPLWIKPPGINNSIGTLVLHLEANLRDYIGFQLGGVPYTRQHEREFSATGLEIDDLRARTDSLVRMIPEVLSGLSQADWDRTYTKESWSTGFDGALSDTSARPSQLSPGPD